MAFQGLLKLDGEAATPLAEFQGSELVGTRIEAPNSIHKEVYVLPMESVSATKVSLGIDRSTGFQLMPTRVGNGCRHLRPFRLA